MVSLQCTPCPVSQCSFLHTHKMLFFSVISGAPSIKVVDAGELMAEIKSKKEQEEAKRQEKAKKKAEQAAKQQKQESAGPPKDPKEMFRTSEYSQWDASGLPTHDAEGKEITKSQSKKLAKQLEAQKKKFEKWQQQQQQS